MLHIRDLFTKKNVLFPVMEQICRKEEQEINA